MRNQTKVRALLLAAALPLIPAASADAALIHRYSFNNGTAGDSVGVANGQVVLNNATAPDATVFINNGRLDLTSNTGSNAAAGVYVDLPNGITNGAANFTVEGWATWSGNGSGAWQRFFDFGSSDIAANGGEIQPGGATSGYGGSKYFFVTPQTGTDASTGRVNVYNAEVRNAGSDFVNGAQNVGFPVGSEHVFALTRSGNTLTLYQDGIQIVQNTNATQDPTTIAYLNDWIGRSQFSGDGLFKGTLNEFRIYDSALTAPQLLANVAAGPNSVPEPAALSTLAAAAALLLRRARRARS